MKLLALIVSLPFLAFITLAAHELTEQPTPGQGDEGAEWRGIAGWVLLALYLLVMAAIAAAGSIDYGILGHLLDRHREAGRHRRRYAPGPAETFGSFEVTTVRAYDRGDTTLPVVLVGPVSGPINLVLDEQPTGGER